MSDIYLRDPSHQVNDDAICWKRKTGWGFYLQCTVTSETSLFLYHRRGRQGLEKLSWKRLGVGIRSQRNHCLFISFLLHLSNSEWWWRMGVKFHVNTLETRLCCLLYFHSILCIIYISSNSPIVNIQFIFFIFFRLGSHPPSSVLGSAVSFHSHPQP